jgi:hypothetical protein
VIENALPLPDVLVIEKGEHGPVETAGESNEAFDECRVRRSVVREVPLA